MDGPKHFAAAARLIDEANAIPANNDETNPAAELLLLLRPLGEGNPS